MYSGIGSSVWGKSTERIASVRGVIRGRRRTTAPGAAYSVSSPRLRWPTILKDGNSMADSRIKALTPAELNVEQQALYDSIVTGPRAQGPQLFALQDDEGRLNGPFGLMLHVPGLGSALQELGSAVRYRTAMTARIREIAILTVAAATESEFERYAH